MKCHKLKIGQTAFKIDETMIWDHRSEAKIGEESNGNNDEVPTISEKQSNPWNLEDFVGPKVLFFTFPRSAEVLDEKKRATSVSEAYVVSPRQNRSRYFDFSSHCRKIMNIKRDLAI